MGFWRKDRSVQLFPLWPRSFIPKKLSWATNTLILGWFTNNFTNGYPVLVSSGRSAISILSKLFIVNEFNLFPFVNSCVIQAISHSPSVNLRTSLTNSSDKARHNIIYHQWGYTDKYAPHKPFIEDRVDTFYQTKSSVRLLDSRFEIWSLNKILGVGSGAIIWCQNKEDQRNIQEFISKPSYFFPTFKLVLKVLKNFSPQIFYQHWERSELKNAKLTSFEIMEIFAALHNWNQTYEARRSRVLNFIDKNHMYFRKCELDNFYNSLQSGIIPACLYSKNDIKSTCSFNLAKLHKFNYSHRDETTYQINQVYVIPTYLL
jgi:putative PLP-dependent aminotransferase (TIGR04422 family)